MRHSQNCECGRCDLTSLRTSNTPPYQAQTLSVKNMRTLLSYQRGEVPLDDREVMPLIRKGLAAWKHRAKRYGLTERGRILARNLAAFVEEEISKHNVEYEFAHGAKGTRR